VFWNTLIYSVTSPVEMYADIVSGAGAPGLPRIFCLVERWSPAMSLGIEPLFSEDLIAPREVCERVGVGDCEADPSS
jgi:hypothetical protein